MRIGDVEFGRAVEAVVAFLSASARRASDYGDALVTYTQLSDHLQAEGFPVPVRGPLLSEILRQASLNEQAAGRGVISALVVAARNGRPSTLASRFYQLARSAPFNRRGDDMSIWTGEAQKVHAVHATTSTSPHRERLVNAETLGAWMLTCNPARSDLEAVLGSEAPGIANWSVAPGYRAELMEPGQRVLFWVAGRPGRRRKPGLWGAGLWLAACTWSRPTVIPASGSMPTTASGADSPCRWIFRSGRIQYPGRRCLPMTVCVIWKCSGSHSWPTRCS